LLFLVFLPLVASRIEGAPSLGILLSFESPDGKQIDARETRLIALSVPRDLAPTPFIAAGPFRVTFHGYLNLKIRDQYAFRASGRGEFELLLNGESVLKCSGDDLSTTMSGLIKLKKGPNELIAHYTAPRDGDAMIRLSWAEKNKPFDPIPPMVLSHEDDSTLQQWQQLSEGRELLATRRCIRCHALPDQLQNGAMPEL